MGFTGVYSFLHKKKNYQGTFISPSAMPDDHYDIDFLGTYFADIRRHLTGNNPEYDPVANGRSLAFRVQQDYTPAFACIHMDGEYTAQKALAHASRPQERAKKESRIQILFEELENRSEVGKWTPSSVVNEIKKTLPRIFSFTQEFRDGLAEGLRKVFGVVVDCDGEADTHIARVLAAHPTIVINGVEQRRVVVSGDSDLLVYDSVKYLLRKMPRGDAFHFYTRAEVLEALGFQWSCQLVVYGIVSKNDYTVNIPGFSLKKNLDTILSLEVDEETTVDALLDLYINNMQGRVDNPADVTRERF
ncbi:hypothetical protein BGX33_010541 [Mortierella sp. NVP41]|nr:hypothetical protein BGX33_010541 [Mortierella sp. NVP41]